MIKIPDYRPAANHIMGCKGMEEDTWRRDIEASLKKAFEDGVMKEKEEQDGREQRACKGCSKCV